MAKHNFSCIYFRSIWFSIYENSHRVRTPKLITNSTRGLRYVRLIEIVCKMIKAKNSLRIMCAYAHFSALAQFIYGFLSFFFLHVHRMVCSVIHCCFKRGTKIEGYSTLICKICHHNHRWTTKKTNNRTIDCYIDERWAVQWCVAFMYAILVVVVLINPVNCGTLPIATNAGSCQPLNAHSRYIASVTCEIRHFIILAANRLEFCRTRGCCYLFQSKQTGMTMAKRRKHHRTLSSAQPSIQITYLWHS